MLRHRTEDRYPGCAYDCPVHLYMYSFYPNPEFAHVYSGSEQIREYFLSFERKFGLDRYMRKDHWAEGAELDEEDGNQHVRIRDLRTEEIIHDRCNVLMNRSGCLNEWEWPNIPGIDSSQGRLVHAAKWKDTDYVNGKIVEIIRNG